MAKLRALLVAAAAAAAAHAAPGEPCDTLLTAYFESSEELQYAVSSDGFQWTVLNGGAPVLNTTLPNTSIRDPFLGRGPDGVYRLVATNGYQFGGTRDIVAWTSPDLVHWSAEALLTAMPASLPGITNVWAPEWRWDPIKGSYMVFWAARGNPTPLLDAGCASGNSARFAFFAAYADDGFTTLDDPFLLFDPGCNVTLPGSDGGIDGDIVTDEAGRPVMVFKDAAGANESVRGVRLAYSASGTVAGPWTTAGEGSILATKVEAPELVNFGDQWLWYFDCSFNPTPPGWPRPPYGVATSPHLAPANFTIVNGSCTDTNPALAFPKGMTHGSFLCLTASELAPVLAAFPAAGRALGTAQ